MSAARSWKELAWLPLVLGALLLIYLPGLDNPPLFDDAYLADGTLFTDYASLTQPRARLLSYGSFIWIQEIFGEGWWKQRIANLLIHVGVVMGLWGFYREVLARVEPPRPESAESILAPLERSPALGFAIAFFALNPVAVYAVAYLIQRSILLATFFVVTGLWAFARGIVRGQRGYHAVAIVCYVLAIASKEHAVLAPLAALPVYALLARPRPARLAGISAILGIGIGAAGWALSYRYGSILGQAFDEFSRVYLVQLAQLNPDAPAHAYLLSILNQTWLFFEYGVRWMLPYSGWMSINLRPPFPVAILSFPQVLGPIAYAGTIAGGAFLLLRYRDWRSLLGLSILLAALLFATELATVWVQDPFVLYRSYLWAIGIPGLVFCLLHGPSGRVVLGGGVVVGAMLTWQALDRVLSMGSAESVWSDAIAKLPQDPRAVGRWFPYLARGNAYLERDELDLALTDFDNSSALGDLGMGRYNMGAVLAAKGKHPQALAAFDEAEKQGYDLYNLPVQRGLSLAALNRREEALRQFEAAWKLAPPSPTAEVVLLNMGRLALQLDNADVAASALDGVLAKQPGNKEARYLRAMTHVKKGEPDAARELFTRLLAEEPSVAAYFGRATANLAAGRKAEARADIEQALRGDPRNPQLRQLQERILAMP